MTVEELRLDESDLNTKRMLDLMAVSSLQGGGMPLYLHVVTRILRDLRIVQQMSGGNFDYTTFRQTLELQDLTPGQMAPLQQRLDTLESFMPKQQVQFANLQVQNANLAKKKGPAQTLAQKPKGPAQTPPKKQNGAAQRAGNIWTPKVTFSPVRPVYVVLT